MTKRIFAVISFVFASIGALSASDRPMPQAVSSYETHPYFLNIYGAESVIVSEYSLRNVRLLSSPLNFTDGSFYSFMKRREAYDPVLGVGYAGIDIPNKTAYDLSILRDLSTTRIYASLGKRDSTVEFASMSRLSLESSSLLEHETILYGGYGRYLAAAKVSGGMYEGLAGYRRGGFAAMAGAGTGGRILCRASANLFGCWLLSDVSYNYRLKSFDAKLFSEYHFHYERLHLTPQISYDSVLTARIGALYRVLPWASAYANYSRTNESGIISAGMKISSGWIEADILPLCLTDGKEGMAASLLAGNGSLSLNLNAQYADSLVYSAYSLISASFFSGNLSPALIAGYDSQRRADIILKVRIVDADVFFGGRLFLDSREYLLKGGFTWLFSD